MKRPVQVDRNLWRGPNYRIGESIMIMLHASHTECTKICVEQWAAGNWQDITLTLLGGMIYPNVYQDDREWIINQLAIGNLVERVMQKSSDSPTVDDYLKSQPILVSRLKLWRPKLLVCFAGDSGLNPQAYVVRAAELAGMASAQIVVAPHPYSRNYDSMEASAKIWRDSVKPHLRQKP